MRAIALGRPELAALVKDVCAIGDRHKDDNAHYNARKMRHHRPVQLEIFYCELLFLISLSLSLSAILCALMPVGYYAVQILMR